MTPVGRPPSVPPVPRASGIGASLSFERVSAEDGNAPLLSRSPQLPRRAASDHDGLKAPPTPGAAPTSPPTDRPTTIGIFLGSAPRSHAGRLSLGSLNGSEPFKISPNPPM